MNTFMWLVQQVGPVKMLTWQPATFDIAKWENCTDKHNWWRPIFSFNSHPLLFPLSLSVFLSGHRRASSGTETLNLTPLCLVALQKKKRRKMKESTIKCFNLNFELFFWATEKSRRSLPNWDCYRLQHGTRYVEF